MGSVLTCVLGRGSNNISFEVDGQALGAAFTDVLLDELCAALNFVGTLDIQLTLIGY